MDYAPLQEQYDSVKMDMLIERFLDDFALAWEIGAKAPLPAGFGGAKHVVGLGMGGSGMGYTLLTFLARQFGTASVEVVSDYHLPPYVSADSGTVVCATSFSGNTEETLSAVAEAQERGVPILCITTGGKLAAWAKEHRAALATFTYPVSLPRVGLAYTFGVVFSALTKAGILRPGAAGYSVPRDDFPNLNRYISMGAMKTFGQDIAEKVHGKLIYVVGSGFSFAVATRWKGQFNENAKTIAFAELMPEMCHNMYLGYRLPEAIRTNSAVIFLDSHHDHAQNRKRNGLVMEDLAKDGVTVLQPEWPSKLTPISTLLAQLIVGDWASYYLALLNHVDPADTSRIEELKARL